MLAELKLQTRMTTIPAAITALAIRSISGTFGPGPRGADAHSNSTRPPTATIIRTPPINQSTPGSSVGS